MTKPELRTLEYRPPINEEMYVEFYTFASRVANGYFLDYESAIDEAERLMNKYELED